MNFTSQSHPAAPSGLPAKKPGRMLHGLSLLICAIARNRAVVCIAAALIVSNPLVQVSRSESKPSGLVDSLVGERLVFLVEWKPPWYLFFLPPMEAGEAELARSGEVEYKGRKVLKIEFRAHSSGTLAKLAGIEVDDCFEFFTDPETFCTYAVVKKEREGKRKRDIEVEYFSQSRQLHIRELDLSTSPPTVMKDRYRGDVPECVKDLFSALYFTRKQEFSAGLRFRAMVGDNERVKEVEARVEKLETVHTPAGVFKAWKVNTVALVGGLFKEGGQFRMWVSADSKKAPVQFEAKVSLGTVTGKLKSAQY